MRTIWSGTVGGLAHTLVVGEVYEGPLVDPITEEPIPGAHAIVWSVIMSSEDGAEQQGWWDPRARGLSLHLAGWSMAAIGALKRHLISLGEHPR